jgi:hypothetical protein
VLLPLSTKESSMAYVKQVDREDEWDRLVSYYKRNPLPLLDREWDKVEVSEFFDLKGSLGHLSAEEEE